MTKFEQILFILILCTFALSACDRQKTVCEDTDITYIDNPDYFPALEEVESGAALFVEINKKMTAVDRIVTGPICNEHWTGKVYVACDIEIAAWGEAPRFFEECDFTIEPGATIIVAPHNNEPFYRGCSCHTGEDLLE
jgi:hypothetical protein